ncbi:very-short-patch-repair endonuclease [Paenibacillus sp. DS2015]|uniref:zinc-ribbon domain-containing protein n=1 Tax=Paenibacillus sp. DS2015 TaxID=3373917 RepID=UPI003D23817B
MILETEVGVQLNSQNTKYYEVLGYEIPRRKGMGGRISVPRGTVISVKVSDLPLRSNVKLTKICDVCEKHIKGQTYDRILTKRSMGEDVCSACSSTKSNNQKALEKAKSGNNLASVYPEAAKLWNYVLNGPISPDKVTPKSNTKVWWLCDEVGCGHSWKAAVADIANGNRCPVCFMSKGERRIREHLRTLNCEFSTQVSMKNLIGIGGGLLSYDFVVKMSSGHMLLIEFDGIGHFKPTDFHGKGEAHALKKFHIQVEHDRRKDNYAATHGIPLLRIRHDEFDNIEQKVDEALMQMMRRDQFTLGIKISEVNA